MLANVGETIARKPRGRPFKKGQSANPAGRPKGARNRATVISETLFDWEAEALTRKAIEKAKGGDVVCLKLCLDRILPPRRDRGVRFDLPKMCASADATAVMARVLEAVACGDLTPSEGEAVSRLVATWIQALQVVDIEHRLAALEDASCTVR